jgi:hypothetical protein
MDTLVEKAGEIILGYGMPGVIIIGLLFDRWRILTALSAATDARIADGRDLSKVVAENTAAMNKLAESTDETAEVTRTLANAVQLMDRTVERLGAERGR